jgi:hypothetical protein
MRLHLVVLFILTTSWVSSVFGQEAENLPAYTVDDKRLLYANVNGNGTFELLIAAQNNMTMCRMDSDPCSIYFLVRNDLASHLEFTSNDRVIFTFETADFCTTDAKCPSLEQLGLKDSELTGGSLSYYTISRVQIKGVLIGNATLEFHLNKSVSLENLMPFLPETVFFHRVVVSAPRRSIDIIFDIWIWSFGALISLSRLLIFYFFKHIRFKYFFA